MTMLEVMQTGMVVSGGMGFGTRNAEGGHGGV